MFNILKSILVIFMIVSLDARDVPGVDFDTLLREGLRLNLPAIIVR